MESNSKAESVQIEKSDAVTMEHMSNVIHGLNEKLSVANGKLSELEEVRNKLHESEKIRIDLSLCLKESGDKVLSQSLSEETFKAEILNKNKEMLDENHALREELRKVKSEKAALEDELNKSNAKIKTMESDITVLQQNIKEEEATTAVLEKLSEIAKLTEKNQVSF